MEATLYVESISAARRPPTEVVEAVVFIGEELFILATLVLCRAHSRDTYALIFAFRMCVGSMSVAPLDW